MLDFQLQPPPGRLCTIAWPECAKYYRDLRSKAEDMLDKFVERSVVTYFIQIEEHHRQWALEQLRVKANKLSFGQALVLSLKEQRNAWYDFSTVLCHRNESAPRSSSSASVAGPTAAARMGVSTVSDVSKKPATGSHTKAGLNICKKFNDRRVARLPASREQHIAATSSWHRAAFAEQTQQGAASRGDAWQMADAALTRFHR